MRRSGEPVREVERCEASLPDFPSVDDPLLAAEGLFTLEVDRVENVQSGVRTYQRRHRFEAEGGHFNGMKARRNSAASIAASSAHRLSAMSRACGSRRVPVRSTFVERWQSWQLLERVRAVDRPDRHWCRGDAARLRVAPGLH